MRWHPRFQALVLALGLGLVSALPRFTSSRIGQPAGSFAFEVAMSAGGGGFAQLYYDAGRRFNEQDSVRQDLKAGPGLQAYRLPLPFGIYRSVRFDPINHRGQAVFRDARIVDAGGRVVAAFPPGLFLDAFRRNATHDIASLDARDGTLAVRTVMDGDDPYIVIELGRPLLLGPGSWARIGNALPVFAIVFLAVFAAGSLLPESAVAWTRKGSPGTRMALAGCGLVAFKLWLVSAQPVYAIGDAGHDDQLFLQLANHLLSGDWLGPYSQFTLMKGPLYPLFIAGVFLLGIPLFLAQHLLYAAACGLVAGALEPLVRRRALRAAVFAVLLFNPITFDGERTMRVARQDLLPALVLLIVAGLVGFHARCGGPKRRLVPWAALTAAALPAFWLTREEGVWMLPCVVLLWGAAGLRVWLDRKPDRAARLGLLASPALFWAAAVAAVAAVNGRYYGIFTTCEFRQAEFRDAYGALNRVEPAHWRPYIVVPRETRERIYGASPAFAELRPYLEGPVGEDWARVSQGVTHLPPTEREIGGGWFIWALRDAVVDAGHGSSGTEAMAYYARLAREVNAACDRGVLRAGPRRSGFLPPLRREHLAPVLAAARRAAEFLFYFNDMGAGVPPSQGAPENLRLFSDLTRGRLSPGVAGPPLPPKQRWLDRVRMGVLDEITLVYSWGAPWAVGGGLLALASAIGIGAARRRVPYFAILGAGLFASVCAMVGVASLIDGTSFTAVDVYYLVGCYAPVLLLVFTGWLALAEVLRDDRDGAGRPAGQGFGRWISSTS
jgi:hypothetical protein